MIPKTAVKFRLLTNHDMNELFFCTGRRGAAQNRTGIEGFAIQRFAFQPQHRIVCFYYKKDSMTDYLMCCLSPLEQFSLIQVVPISLTHTVVLSLSNATVFTLVPMGLVMASVKLSLGRGYCRVTPLGWQTLWECFYEFIDGMCREQLGSFRRRFTTSIFAIFTLLISLNLFGLLPYSFTVTSQLSITLSFSTSLFIGITLFGIKRHGLGYFLTFFMLGAVGPPQVEVVQVQESSSDIDPRLWFTPQDRRLALSLTQLSNSFF